MIEAKVMRVDQWICVDGAILKWLGCGELAPAATAAGSAVCTTSRVTQQPSTTVKSLNQLNLDAALKRLVEEINDL